MNDRPDERIDDLVRDADRRALENAPDDEVTATRDRDAVLSRIDRTPKPEDRPLPWWRIVAPVAVAAGLAGLFLMEDRFPPGPTAPAPVTEDVVAPKSVDAPSPTARDAAPFSARVEAGRGTTAAEPLRISPVAPEVDAILDRLGPSRTPLPLATAVRDSLIERLRTLRPELVDPARRERVDAWIAPRR